MDDTITIPRAEYERLLAVAEDASDARAIEGFKTELARGEEEYLPSEFVDRMLAGDNIVSLWREHRGLGKAELAKLADIHRVTLAKIESGERGPAVEALKKLATALNVTTDDLV